MKLVMIWTLMKYQKRNYKKNYKINEYIEGRQKTSSEYPIRYES